MYAEAMTDWEGWQGDYRFGVLLIFPPEPLRGRLNELRRHYDPRSQSYCDAHISLTVPATRALAPTDWHALEAAGRRCSPVRIEYGPLKVYEGHPGVNLAIEPVSELDEVRRTVEAVSPFAEAPPRGRPFSPHMTIAEFITMQRTEEIVRELQGLELNGSFLSDFLDYAVPDEGFKFTQRRRLRLGTG